LKKGEKISNLENASQNLIHLPLTICKKTLKRISKRVCKKKQNKWCKAWSKMLKLEESIHAYLMKYKIGLIPSNLCTYLLQTSSITALIYLLWFVLASITKKGEIEREIGSNLFLNDFGG
jgi:hypothetical protein